VIEVVLLKVMVLKVVPGVVKGSLRGFPEVFGLLCCRDVLRKGAVVEDESLLEIVQLFSSQELVRNGFFEDCIVVHKLVMGCEQSARSKKGSS